MGENKKDNALGDIVKKVVSVGMGAAFMTEDAVKNVLEGIPLPKDIVTGLVQNAKGAKEEFTKSVREEVRNYLSQVDSTKLVQDILDRYDVEVTATFKFKKKEDGTQSDSKKS